MTNSTDRTSTLTPAQRRKIFATAGEIRRRGDAGTRGRGDEGRTGTSGDDVDAWVHGVVYRVTGKESVRELTVQEGKRVIDFLEGLAGRKPNREWHEHWGASVDEEGHLLVLITPAQASKLRAIAARIGWEDRQVCTVVSRQLGRHVSSLRAIRAEEAARVMGLIESIVERREREQKQMQFKMQNAEGRMQSEGSESDER